MTISEAIRAHVDTGTRQDWRLGSLGYLAGFVFSLALVMATQGPRLVVACGVVVALAAAFYPAGLRTLAAKRVWLLVGMLLVPAALFLAPEETPASGVPWWLPGLLVGLQMALRALAVLVAASGFAASVSISELSALMERAGAKGLGFAIGVAVNVLPTVQEMLTNAYQALRLRGGFRRERLKAVRCLLVTVIANSLRHADDVVSAAEARAFSVERSRPREIRAGRADLLLAVVLASLTLVMTLL